VNWYFWFKNRTGCCRQWRWYRQWHWASILASLESESWQCGTLLNLRYSTLLVSLVFQCILTAYSRHRFITLKDRLGVIAVVRNLYNICTGCPIKNDALCCFAEISITAGTFAAKFCTHIYLTKIHNCTEHCPKCIKNDKEKKQLPQTRWKVDTGQVVHEIKTDSKLCLYSTKFTNVFIRCVCICMTIDKNIT